MEGCYVILWVSKTLVTDISFGSALHHKEGNFQKLTKEHTWISAALGTKPLLALAIIYTESSLEE